MTAGASKAATTITQPALVSSPQSRPAPTRRALPSKRRSKGSKLDADTGGAGVKFARRLTLEVEGADKDRQPPQHHTLRLGQQFVAPIERRPQGLVPRQGRALSAGQQAEAIVEAGGKPLDTERGDAGRRQLDRPRDAVKAPAECRDQLGEGSIRRKTRIGGPCALQEQPNRSVFEYPPLLDIRCRHGQRRHRVDPFALGLEQLTARSKDAQL